MEKQRVRLSSIDLLPPDAEQDVVWAVAEIEANNRLQIDILAEFNARLADRGIGPISPSAFSRFALRKRLAFRRLKEVREISNALATTLEPGGDDALTIAVAQLIKTAVFEQLEQGGKIDSKGVMELAKALQSTVSAQRASTARRQQVEQAASEKASKVIDAVATEAGLSSERIAQLRREFLGVRPKAPATSEAGA